MHTPCRGGPRCVATWSRKGPACGPPAWAWDAWDALAWVHGHGEHKTHGHGCMGMRGLERWPKRVTSCNCVAHACRVLSVWVAPPMWQAAWERLECGSVVSIPLPSSPSPASVKCVFAVPPRLHPQQSHPPAVSLALLPRYKKTDTLGGCCSCSPFQGKVWKTIVIFEEKSGSRRKLCPPA